MNQNLGTGFQSFTRKVPFDTCVKERYRSVLKDRILSASEDVRQLLFRAQMFVNYFIILHSNENISGCNYRQFFWYSICQLVNNRRVKNSNVIPPGMLDDRNNFNQCGVTCVLWRALKKREKEGDLLVVTIDEFMTSKLCNICYKGSLKKVDGVKGYSVLGCQNFNMEW
ncbi:hypothetical protein INT46_011508 [Mucor plumbeus]|uniref:Uncharacterized protein n=1 Tax=Mucor plumbeus TaxID=97098 RepID=A0A8H7QEA8_9FUNG|nr:hypothetical protein INT46_011508 [Mucor plumbeus]